MVFSFHGWASQLVVTGAPSKRDKQEFAQRPSPQPHRVIHPTDKQQQDF